VIAGTAVMGTLLVMLLTTGAGLTAQSAKARRAQQACRLADEFLESSWKDKSKFLTDQAGQLPGHPGWAWRTRLRDSQDFLAGGLTSGVASELMSQLKIHRVSVDIFAPGALAGDAPSASVEILVTDKPVSTSQQSTTGIGRS
jgi:type II secretory pathway pseudopilin PulG